MNERERAAREFIAGVDRRGDALERFELFAGLLRQANETQNLVSAGSLDDMWSRHFQDSVQLLPLVPRGTNAWLDLGSGAGFPGIALAIVEPERIFHLVESRPLRSDWLLQAVEALGLGNVQIHASELKKVATEPFGVISARAFSPLPRLVEAAARFSTSDTCWVLPKGRSAAQELEALQGWKHTFHVEQSLTDDSAGIIVGAIAGRKGR